jgi:hypothetical protein
VDLSTGRVATSDLLADAYSYQVLSELAGQG